MRQGRLYYTAVGALICQCHFAFCAKMSARRFCAKQIPKICNIKEEWYLDIVKFNRRTTKNNNYEDHKSNIVSFSLETSRIRLTISFSKYKGTVSSFQRHNNYGIVNKIITTGKVLL